MKRFAKSVLGVTLLEIMLVLAIAAMVIVMSVRYYQSATIGQQTNSFIAQLQALTSAADSLAQGAGSYSGLSDSAIKSIAGGGDGAFKTPWGETMTLAYAATSITFTVPNTPPAVCELIKARLATNTHWSNTAGSPGPLTSCGTIVYNSNT